MRPLLLILLAALPAPARAQAGGLTHPCETRDLPAAGWPEVFGQSYALRLPPGFREVEAATPPSELDTFDRREWRAGAWRVYYEEGYNTTAQPADSGVILGRCSRQLGTTSVSISVARVAPGGHGAALARFQVVAFWGTPGDYAYRLTGLASTPMAARRLAAAFGTLTLHRPQRRHRIPVR